MKENFTFFDKNYGFYLNDFVKWQVFAWENFQSVLNQPSIQMKLKLKKDTPKYFKEQNFKRALYF